MANDEENPNAQMTKHYRTRLTQSGFVIHSSLGIRHLSFLASEILLPRLRDQNDIG
jgi:hypothetical protein